MMAFLTAIAHPLLAASAGRTYTGVVVVTNENGETEGIDGVEIWLDGRSDTTKSVAKGVFKLYCPEAYKAGNVLPIVIKKKG